MRQCAKCRAVLDLNDRTVASSVVVRHRGDIQLLFCNCSCESAFNSARRPIRWRNWVLLALACALILGLVLYATSARSNPPKNAQGTYRQWYLDQKQLDEPPVCNSDGICAMKSCCGGPEEEGGDGRKVNVRSVGRDRYEVQIGDQWILYPRDVPRAIDNPTGANIAWFTISTDGQTVHWYCLRIALGV